MIWITQWLCPSRHCAIAVAWDDQEATAQNVEYQGEQVFRQGTLNRWCGICGGSLDVEHGRTAFKTMEEALPHIKAIEKANLQARSIVGGKF
ncbi:hypothetical protein LCGC14_2980130 [marine sediment metagenome]|uniref:Uncharacterized protein n=1 Tax=marine sediment metagenome TaxID=412755 RepID=A0A0F8ZY17_9ZZZZ